MPPFIPTKRSLSPPTQPSPRLKRPATEQHVLELLGSSESSLSDLSSKDEDDDDDDDDEDDWQDVKQPSSGKSQAKNRVAGKDNADDDDESVDWEDAIGTTTCGYASYKTPAQDLGIQDLELTLDGIGSAPTTSLLDTKKGPSQIERSIRTNTHKAHVQCLLFHNAIRNSWLNDKKVHDILRGQLPAGIQKEIQRWRIASALDPPPSPPPSKDNDATKAGKKKGSKKNKKKKTETSRDWGGEAKRLEPGQPDMSHGDPILQLLRVLAAYWKRNFKVTAPGLRKHGYRSAVSLEALIASFKKGELNVLLHGERIADRHEFRVLAAQRQGSRDVGAQLFTALLRSLGIEARLVSNLQPLGFGWTKAETDTSFNVQSEATGNQPLSVISDTENEIDNEGSSAEGKGPKVSQFDRDLSFPTYWAEVVSPITHEIIPVDPLILSNSVAATPEMVSAFEPRGSRADKAKQVIAYVVAHSPDGTAKDVTTRYLKRQTWPGKTKGYRLPVEKMTLRISKRGPTYVIDQNWFNKTMRGYVRTENERKMVDDIEDAKDLVANQPEKKTIKKETDTLQSLKASTEFVLERFLRREEALRPGAKVVRKFMSGKGDKAKEENVYRRADVLRCLSAESWHKEGRRPKIGEAPLKRVPIRAVTLMRKREVEELARQTGEKPLQGLYARYQTEFIIPPPIQNGIIPKNEYGNIDCFVPTMVPRGATHIPWGGTVRICKKLGIDYAEAVTGFEFGSKMAVPVIDGVVVADENANMVRDAWQADQEMRREKERLAHEKRILQTWRKFIMGLRIMERVRVEYGDDGDAELDNPFQRPQRRVVQSVDVTGESGTQEASGEARNEKNNYEDDHDHEENDINADLGGGFLLPGHGDEEMNDLVVDHGDKIHREAPRTMHDEDDAVDESETGVADFELASLPSEEEYKPPARSSNRRRRRGR